MSGRMWSICWTFPPGGNRRGNRKNHDNRFSPLLFFSVPTERAAITAGDDLRGLGTCHQQAFWQEYRKRIPAKIRNLTEDCIACHSFYGDGVCLVEWADLIEEILPRHYVRITIKKDLEKGFDYRKIEKKEVNCP